MTSRRCGPPDIARSIGFENGNAAIMHAQHHGRGSTLFRDTPHDGGGASEPKAEAADLGGTHGAQKTTGFQSLNALIREGSIAIRGGCICCDALPADPVERLFICLRNWVHCLLGLPPARGNARSANRG